MHMLKLGGEGALLCVKQCYHSQVTILVPKT